MYFWNIESLESDLRRGRVGDREALYYILWLGGSTIVAYTALSLLETQNLWDHIDSAFSLAAFLVGVPYLFRRNGGSAGTDFLLSDEMLRAVAANGGVVMINFFVQYLDARKTTPWKMVVDWVAHFGGSETSVASVADHIELGGSAGHGCAMARS